MKPKPFILFFLFIISASFASSQYVKLSIGFPSGTSIASPGKLPFVGAVWIGPEWVWKGGHYQCLPGHWEKPKRHGLVWQPGYWKHSRRGYSWVKGGWR